MPASITARSLLLISVGVVGLSSCSDPAATTPPVLTVVAVAASNDQSGVVGQALSQPLRVRVRSDDAPKAGATVTWEASAGNITPASSVTDTAGLAVATWTLGTVAGAMMVYAKVAEAQGSPVAFSATALPGPVSGIRKVDGDGQTSPVNHAGFRSLIAMVTDQYGNGIEGQAVTWTVESGPVTLVSAGGATDGSGQSVAMFAPNGTQGNAVVRAALPDGGAAVDFALTAGPPTWYVSLTALIDSDYTLTGFAFSSRQNGSRSPANDTIPVGGTLTWTRSGLSTVGHGVVSVGAPSFHGGDFPRGLASTLSVTFPTRGTYHYADSHNPDVTGIIVVQ